jgi:two-component system phosphate regulon sensor histidine kinase PhoR
VDKLQREKQDRPFEESSLGKSGRRKTFVWSFTTAQITSVALTYFALIGATLLDWISGVFAFALAVIVSVYSYILGRKYDRDVARLTRNAARIARDQERARAKTQAPLRSKIVQGFVDPLLMIDAKRKVVEANAAARDLFGATIIGKDLSFFIRTPNVLEAIKEAMNSGRPAECEFLFDKEVGHHFSMRAAMVANELADDEEAESDTPFYIVLAFSDITKVKLAERMRADFVANASHELRTPLTTLIGFIETLQGPAKTDTKAMERFLSIMDEEAGRMVRVIDDLLSLSRIELDKHVSPTESVDLSEIIKGIGHSLEMSLKEDNRIYKTDIAPDLPLARADRDQVIQVLQNLVSNAIKYGQSGTEITIRAKRTSPSEIKVEVADRGEGIPSEHIPRLTERFYRVDTARSRQMGGTGLGLAIVKHIIERHRGRLSIDSIQGKGTTISFTLPVSEETTGKQR